MTTMLIPMSGTVRGRLLFISRVQTEKVTRTSHDGSYCTYEVDKSAFYANVLCRIPVSNAVVIVLLKTDTIWWLNGRPSDCANSKAPASGK